jgi:hypothetical protein
LGAEGEVKRIVFIWAFFPYILYIKLLLEQEMKFFSLSSFEGKDKQKLVNVAWEPE